MKEIRVAYQKHGVLVIARDGATLEEFLLGLIPRPIPVRDIVRRNPQT